MTAFVKPRGLARIFAWTRVRFTLAISALLGFLLSLPSETAMLVVIAWRDDAGAPHDAVIRTPLKELVTQLDPEQFAQVHRSFVVNLRAISHVTRGLNETADIHLKGREDVLPVSRSYLHLFKQM
jgi:hypothetical protein